MRGETQDLRFHNPEFLLAGESAGGACGASETGDNAGMATDRDKPRVALAHHWLMSMRGGEKTVAALAELFPEAPIYSLLARPEMLDEGLRRRELRLSWLRHLNWIPDLQRKALPVLAAAARSLDARDFDAVICSDAAIIKAIRTRPDALKICYCHSPMRYVWDLHDAYYRDAGPVGRLGLRLFAPGLREADRRAAEGVTAFIANSRTVAERIRRNYGRACVVIPPPVEVEFDGCDVEAEDFYLVVGECVGYKRHDLAIEACTRLGRRLIVIGTGPKLAEYRRRAGACVQLLGWQDDAVVREHMRRCRALLFCGEEDFGLVPVEAQAAGRPVIAYRAGGAMETVVEGGTGVFFDAQNVESAIGAIERFESSVGLWSGDRIRAHATQFSKGQFCQRFMSVYEWLLGLWRKGGPTAAREAVEARGRVPDSWDCGQFAG
jgi:glycosyltransferase involved in cell wall biosynthesis